MLILVFLYDTEIFRHHKKNAFRYSWRYVDITQDVMDIYALADHSCTSHISSTQSK
jgi:hypothetical protein